jgi:hypothetical protein
VIGRPLRDPQAPGGGREDPLDFTTERDGFVEILYVARVALRRADDPELAHLRLWWLVDGQLAPPTEVPMALGPSRWGQTVHLLACLRLPAGRHSLRIFAQAAPGATYEVTHGTVTVKSVFVE